MKAEETFQRNRNIYSEGSNDKKSKRSDHKRYEDITSKIFKKY